jgi:hypothetical protein
MIALLVGFMTLTCASAGSLLIAAGQAANENRWERAALDVALATLVLGGGLVGVIWLGVWLELHR